MRLVAFVFSVPFPLAVGPQLPLRERLHLKILRWQTTAMISVVVDEPSQLSSKTKYETCDKVEGQERTYRPYPPAIKLSSKLSSEVS
jgi:hypothetical protein